MPDINSKISVTPVILCGGSGTRLWPLSRSGFPKQFLILSGTTSLFQQSLERVNSIDADDIELNETLIVTGEEHRFLALDQLREMKKVDATLLLEPAAKNTAPALTLAALKAIQRGDDPVLAVMPADQTIQNAAAFNDALQRAVRVASNGSVVVLGVSPDKPETGYGYIRWQGEVSDHGEYEVIEFAEKPDTKTAEAYLENGHYLWNAGMFLVRASVWLKALRIFRPDIFEATNRAFLSEVLDLPFVRPDKALYQAIPSDSIDYAVMEQCAGSNIKVKVIPLESGWNDMVSWDAVWQVGHSDKIGNVVT